MEKLTQAQKQELANRILNLDPAGEIVSLSPNQQFTGGSISYNRKAGIVLHENIVRLTDEEYVRAYAPPQGTLYPCYHSRSAARIRRQ